jgi:hypothetical protein
VWLCAVSLLEFLSESDLKVAGERVFDHPANASERLERSEEERREEK